MLISTYTNPRKNSNVLNFDIDGRALNMQKFPFNLPDPIEIINEKYTGQNGEYNDKSLALWKLDSIKTRSIAVRILLSLPFFFIKSAFRTIFNV